MALSRGKALDIGGEGLKSGGTGAARRAGKSAITSDVCLWNANGAGVGKIKLSVVYTYIVG